LPALPDLRTLADHGIQGVEVASGWHGLFAPAGTPAGVIAALSAALQPVLASPKIRERIIALGAEPAASSPDELAAILSGDIARLGPIVKQVGASLD
jgi:tripartite-type tricarboxylate transporter receptor subunit TctC